MIGAAAAAGTPACASARSVATARAVAGSASSGQLSMAKPRSLPGARPAACIAASMTMVPAPHIGSHSAVPGVQPASASSPAASVSRSGASPVSTRAPAPVQPLARRVGAEHEAILYAADQQRDRRRLVVGAGVDARHRVRDGQHRRLGQRSRVVEAAAGRAGAHRDRRAGRNEPPPRQPLGAPAQLAELARLDLAHARQHARRDAQPQVGAIAAGGGPGPSRRLPARRRPPMYSGSASTSRRATSSSPGATTANQRSGLSVSVAAAPPRGACGRAARRVGAGSRGARRSESARAPRWCPRRPRPAIRSDRPARSPSPSPRVRTLSRASRRSAVVSAPGAFSLRSGSSNCGLTSTTPSAPGRRRNASPRSMLRAATKLTSTVKKSNGPSAIASDSRFQSTPSSDVTRSSARSDACSWPCPTSTATTLAAPCASSASVKPPVDAPTSIALAPLTRGDPKTIERCLELPARAADGHVANVSGARAAPGRARCRARARARRHVRC